MQLDNIVCLMERLARYQLELLYHLVLFLDDRLFLSLIPILQSLFLSLTPLFLRAAIESVVITGAVQHNNTWKSHLVVLRWLSYPI